MQGEAGPASSIALLVAEAAKLNLSGNEVSEILTEDYGMSPESAAAICNVYGTNREALQVRYACEI